MRSGSAARRVVVSPWRDRRRRVAGRAALAALALGAPAGCGSETPPRSEQARAAVDTFLALCFQQRAPRLLDVLQPAAQRLVISAPSTVEGCGRVLKAPASARAVPEAYHEATAALSSFDGNAAHFDVTIGGTRRPVTATYGFGLWRLEGPGS